MLPRSSIGLALQAPRLPPRIAAARAASLTSVLVHLAVAALVVLAASGGASVVTSPLGVSRAQATLPRTVFLLMPQPGGGGGGGGTRTPLPRSVARDLTPPRVSQQPADVPAREEAMLDAIPIAAGTTLIAGLPEAYASPALSGGPGTGGGIGTGTGTGVGPGAGPGLGPGSGGGFGGGAYRPGDGVTAPRLLRQVLPKYTPQALERKIQGTVVLDVVVGRHGVATTIRVVQSLDPGLDAEAVAAVRQWQFAPGTLGSTPVDVLVSIWIDFRVV